MQPHDPSHGALLERILVGDLPRTTAEARAVLDHCQACRESLGQLDRLQRQLAEAGAEERAGVAEAASANLDPASERRVRKFVLAQAHPQRKPSHRGRNFALALAASLCALVAYGVLRPVQPTQTPDVDLPLGGAVAVTVPELISPIGVVDRVEELDNYRWRGPTLAAGESYTLRITNLNAPDAEALVIDYIEEPRWLRASPGVLASPRAEKFFSANPTKIEWQVEIHGNAKASERSSPREKAWLR